jgi:electron-transferring-flavoprotein dehydrogenase
VRDRPIGKDLKKVRNVKPLWSKAGLAASLTLGGFDMWTNNLLRLLALRHHAHGKTDAEATEKASKHKPIDYPKPDGVLSFDRLTNVSLLDDQPRGKPARAPARSRTRRCRSVEPAEIRRAGAALLPGGRLRGGARGRQGPALRDQLPELRALQDLRHQGSQPEHRLDVTPQGGDGPNYPNM